MLFAVVGRAQTPENVGALKKRANARAVRSKACAACTDVLLRQGGALEVVDADR